MTDLFTNVKQGDQITFTIKLGPYVNEAFTPKKTVQRN